MKTFLKRTEILCLLAWFLSASSYAAVLEGRSADAVHTVWDGDGSQAATTREGTVADAGHTVGDDGVLTTTYQSV